MKNAKHGSIGPSLCVLTPWVRAWGRNNSITAFLSSSRAVQSTLLVLEACLYPSHPTFKRWHAQAMKKTGKVKGPFAPATVQQRIQGSSSHEGSKWHGAWLCTLQAGVLWDFVSKEWCTWKLAATLNEAVWLQDVLLVDARLQSSSLFLLALLIIYCGAN